MMRDDDDYRKEFTDAYVSANHGLSKQSVGFVGANRRRGTDLGVSGVPLDFDAGAPERLKPQADPVGRHITPAVGGDAVPVEARVLLPMASESAADEGCATEDAEFDHDTPEDER